MDAASTVEDVDARFEESQGVVDLGAAAAPFRPRRG